MNNGMKFVLALTAAVIGVLSAPSAASAQISKEIIGTWALVSNSSVTPDEYCAQKAAASGSSFYYAFLFLPPERRRAITAVYAYCREVDDIVDEVTDTAVAHAKLAWWMQEIDRLYRTIIDRLHWKQEQTAPVPHRPDPSRACHRSSSPATAPRGAATLAS